MRLSKNVCRILHFACIVYLTLENLVVADYHMPTLPYPLIKKEVLLMKQKFLPQCQTKKLGGYANVAIEDFEVSQILENQLPWRKSWLQKQVRDCLYYISAP